MKTQRIPLKDEIHTMLKNYCKEEGLKINYFVEKLIKQELEKRGVVTTPNEKATTNSINNENTK
jgi:hypothetical protein